MDHYGNSVLAYFSAKAAEYDRVDEQHYWRLSDALLWDAFNREVLSRQPGSFHFLDAGGGTGRWSAKILSAYPKASGTIYDLSPQMVEQARGKAELNSGRCSFRIGSIEEMPDIGSESFDIVFNFHNVLGFVSCPQAAMREMARVTRKGGLIVSFVPNLYHGVFFNLFIRKPDEAARVATTARGRFTAEMPDIHFYSPAQLEQLYEEAGLRLVTTLGLPVTIYPGFQETQISGSTGRLADLLSDETAFRAIFEIERELSSDPRAAARGNNLLAIGVK